MPEKAPPPIIPLTLVTGFLGAGKTTLLNRLLQDEALAGSAVIVNEFGEVGLDHLLVETADEGIIEMSSGCLCCTIRGDLVNTLEDLLRRLDNGRVEALSRVVIETTGLADPAPILHTVMTHPYLVMRYRLDGVVTVIDAVNGADTLDAHEEAVKQAAVADRIVLAKSDLVADGAALDGLRARLKRLNPAAPVFDAATGEAKAKALIDAGLYDPETKSPDVARWLRAEAYEDAHGHEHGHEHAHAHTDAHNVNRHDDHIEAFCIATEKPIGINSFNLFCELLQSGYGAGLLRVKGIVLIAEEPDRPVVIHAVQHVFHPPVRLETWPGGRRETRLVFITRDIPKGRMQGLLRAFSEPIDGAEARAAYEARDALSLKPGGGLFEN